MKCDPVTGKGVIFQFKLDLIKNVSLSQNATANKLAEAGLKHYHRWLWWWPIRDSGFFAAVSTPSRHIIRLSWKQLWNQHRVMVVPVKPKHICWSWSPKGTFSSSHWGIVCALQLASNSAVALSEARDHLLSPAFCLFPPLKVPWPSSVSTKGGLEDHQPQHRLSSATFSEGIVAKASSSSWETDREF